MPAPIMKRDSNASETGSVAAGVKRDLQISDPSEESGREKKRRIAPTPVTEADTASIAPPPPPPSSASGGGT